MALYVPGSLPQDTEGLLRFLSAELQKISNALESGKRVDFLHVAPTKPREGILYGADGTDWNPGSGQGVYCYYNGGWNFLG